MHVALMLTYVYKFIGLITALKGKSHRPSLFLKGQSGFTAIGRQPQPLAEA